ncbi:DUF3846 domain-containing protein [Paeniglutamicibacter sp. ABSL32-1]|uniref:DUF3846 domain-containing protein n=1 Tax=Paeniglutamicibacter quisquiliarum TaxID=2849498 RepID=UPI001C2CF7F4|nr:DUF3846 domain-containing protein [Paeniglutamicibacter quisquiliarum]MBV1778722.1 DUF3846 domain-containing protein [Paeniglutamicibacter quisquiliarum]
MVKGIFIPADQEQDIELREYNSLDDYQLAVQGNIEAMDINRPDATIFINEEGKLIDLDTNGRATLIMWVHLSRYRGMDIIQGDVVIIGRPDPKGNTQDVPQELVDLLFNTESYKIEFTTIQGSVKWIGKDSHIDNWTVAYMIGIRTAEGWAGVDEIRVLPV